MTTTPELRAGIYARVSSEMQRDNYSVEAQLQDDRAYCERMHLLPIREYVDVESGRTTNRDAFQQMLADAEAHLFDVLVIPRWDRFSRSVADTIHTLDQLQRWGIRVDSVGEPADRSSDTGWMMLTMHSTFAEWFVRRLSMQTARGKRARAEKGGHNGVIPFGYFSVSRKKGGNGEPQLDPDAAATVKLAFELYSTDGYSAATIADLLNASGCRPTPHGSRTLTTWSPQSIMWLLRNPIYCGDVRYRGQRMPGRHEAIISRELFDLCQTVAARRAGRIGITQRHGTTVYPLTGIGHCARCGRVLTAGSYNLDQPVHRWYRCSAYRQGVKCTQRMIRADDADAAIGEYLAGVALPVDWQDRVLELVAQDRGQDNETEKTVARINRELAKLRDLYVMTDLDKDEYERRRDNLKAQLPTLQPPKLPDLQSCGEMISSFGTIWQTATNQERKQLLRALLEAVYLDAEHGPIVAVVPRSALAALLTLAHNK